MRVTLTDDEIVAAGDAALRLMDLPETASLAPESEPDFVFLACELPGGEEILTSNGIWRDESAVDAAIQVLDGITNDISETATFPAIAFPRCPGHAHPAGYGSECRELWLRCPVTGSEFRRVTV